MPPGIIKDLKLLMRNIEHGRRTSYEDINLLLKVAESLNVEAGAAYKKGGRVTGIAKRGFGRALNEGEKIMRQNGVRSNVRFPYSSSGMKKGGKAKKQGYIDRKDESIAMRIKKKRTPKQLKASRDESYGKWGSGKGKGKINK